MIRQHLNAQNTFVNWDKESGMGSVKIEGLLNCPGNQKRHGEPTCVRVHVGYVPTEDIFYATANAFIEEQLKQKYSMDYDPDPVGTLEYDIEKYLKHRSSHLTGEKTWTT